LLYRAALYFFDTATVAMNLAVFAWDPLVVQRYATLSCFVLAQHGPLSPARVGRVFQHASLHSLDQENRATAAGSLLSSGCWGAKLTRSTSASSGLPA